jgi:hypothetical protein
MPAPPPPNPLLMRCHARLLQRRPGKGIAMRQTWLAPYHGKVTTGKPKFKSILMLFRHIPHDLQRLWQCFTTIADFSNESGREANETGYDSAGSAPDSRK